MKLFYTPSFRKVLPAQHFLRLWTTLACCLLFGFNALGQTVNITDNEMNWQHDNSTVMSLTNYGYLTLNSGLYVWHGSTLRGGTTIGTAANNADLTVYGGTNLEGVTTIGTPATSADLTVYGGTTLHGTLSVYRNTFLHDNLYVYGEMLNVTGRSSFSLDVFLGDRLTVSGTSTLSGDVLLQNNLMVMDTSTLIGDVLMKSDLTVDSLSYFHGNVSITGSNTLSVGGNSTLSGDVLLHNDLMVGGISEFGDHAVLYENLYVWGRSEFTGNVYLDSALSVGGAATIGTDATNANLTVYGQAQVKELYIDPTHTWADYVFAEGYALPSLREVQAYITANGHLPGVPSADQVATEGYAQTEVNALLLSKVEELTLYMIDLEERNQALEASNAELRAMVETLVNLQQEKE